VSDLQAKATLARDLETSSTSVDDLQIGSQWVAARRAASTFQLDDLETAMDAPEHREI
jgi:hypothetical protein